MLMKLQQQLAAKRVKAVQVNMIARGAQAVKAMLVAKGAKVALVRVTSSYSSRGSLLPLFLPSHK